MYKNKAGKIMCERDDRGRVISYNKILKLINEDKEFCRLVNYTVSSAEEEFGIFDPNNIEDSLYKLLDVNSGRGESIKSITKQPDGKYKILLDLSNEASQFLSTTDLCGGNMIIEYNKYLNRDTNNG